MRPGTGKPLVVGLTGGIGSGKSAAAGAFAALGVPVVCTDTLARAVVMPGQPALADIEARFGRDVLQADGSLDRVAMRQRVFRDPASRKALEAIVHPRIRDAVMARLVKVSEPYVVVDIPLLVETGTSFRELLDRVLVVECAAEIRRERIARRDGSCATQVDAMLAAQADDDTRRAIADDVLVNQGSLEDLAAQVAVLDRRYRLLAQHRH